MKKITQMLIVLSFCFSFGQQFSNGNFESVSCATDCSSANSQMTCVDDWFEDYMVGIDPLQKIGCNPQFVCSDDYSIRLSQTSGAPGASVKTGNPFYNLNLQGMPQIVNLDVKVIDDWSTSATGIHIRGTNIGPGSISIDLVNLGFNEPNANDVCENIGIILDPTVVDYEYLQFSTSVLSGSHLGGHASIIDNVGYCGALFDITDNCGNVTIALNDDCNIDIDLTDIYAEVYDINGNLVAEVWNDTGDPLSFSVTDVGVYSIKLYAFYIINGDYVFLETDLEYEVTSVTADPIVITVDGEDITNTLSYTIPCDQDCININATNVSNAVYNTTDLVLTDLNGLFCLPPGSDLQSYTAYIEGQDSCGNDYYQEIEITIEQDCCIDEPYIEPFWELCDSNNVCELENWPIHVLDDDGSPLLIIDGYSFVWSDGSTSDTLYGAVAMQEYWVEVTYPDGCVYTITYYEGCCDDDIEVIFDECPKAEMLPILERELQNYEEGRSVVTRPDLESAIEAYQEMGRADGDDCDPCVGGIVNITIVDLDGNPITNYDSITITNNDTGVTVPVGIPNFGVYVNIPYTVTVVVTDDDGHECTYTYDFEYVCEEEPCSDLMSPSNVQLSGSTLTWDPVPGAIGYVVESTNFWPLGCNCDYPVSISPIETTETSVNLPIGERRCFVVQVRAICADGTSSLPSDWICVGGNGGHGKVIDKVSITPNPTNGHMTFNVETNVDSKVNIEVYDIYGTMLKSFIVEVSQERQSSTYWNGSNLNTGIYFVKFKTNEETIHQRVIVH